MVIYALVVLGLFWATNSVAATEDALRKLSADGYRFVTVPELVA